MDASPAKKHGWNLKKVTWMAVVIAALLMVWLVCTGLGILRW
jgi:hypothetical protein